MTLHRKYSSTRLNGFLLFFVQYGMGEGGEMQALKELLCLLMLLIFLLQSCFLHLVTQSIVSRINQTRWGDLYPAVNREGSLTVSQNNIIWHSEPLGSNSKGRLCFRLICVQRVADPFLSPWQLQGADLSHSRDMIASHQKCPANLTLSAPSHTSPAGILWLSWL